MLKKLHYYVRLALLCVAMPVLLNGCGYNQLQSLDEEVKASWAEVLNQYQRRSDLVPNLVNTVKGYAAHEQAVLEQVAQARAKIGSIQITQDILDNPETFAKYQKAQGELSSALSRLMSITENYPQLKADGLFRDLQAQLEGTENRTTVARNRFIQAVKEYNILARSFPTNLVAQMFGMKVKPSFAPENEQEISQPPRVDFSKPATAQ